MRSDKTQMLSGMTTRQKLTAGALVLIVIVVIWQIMGLFGGGSSSPAPMPTPGDNKSMATMPPQPATPQPAGLVKLQAPTSQREAELIKLQQETQAKYLAAVNELQMLKVTRDIAEANQAITAAQLATVTAQKNIVSLLAPQQPVMPADYARGLVNPVSQGNVVTSAPSTPGQTTTTTVQTTSQQEVNYSVISVSQLQYRWSAVLGYQGSLYNVSVGDVLPADGSVVKSIDKTGVVLERDGMRKKVSLVPVI